MTKILHPSLFTRALAATLFLALTGCGASKSTVDVQADASARLPADAIASPPSSDTALAKDTTPSTNQTPDASTPRADLAIPDTGTGIKDSGRDAAPLPTDTQVVVDATPARADTGVAGDASLRADTQTPDGLGGAPEAAVLACTIVDPAPPMGHLSPKELKAILDSGENPYLINVKGTSIANIPGTDAVLASDVAGIEKLVGGKLCADIILYCRSGATSQTVGNQLVAKGYQNVRDLSGGINAWTAAGYPTE